MTGAPVVSVVMATRNAQPYLAAALASVDAQGISDVEIIVVDAASNDGTREVVNDHAHARLIDQSGIGLAQAWNQGIRESSADLVALLDSDDVWTPGALNAHLDALVTHPEALASIGRFEFVLEGDSPPPGFRTQLLDGNHWGNMPGCTLVRRGVFDVVGWYPEDLQVATDIEWFHRLRSSGIAIVDISRVVLRKRVHDSNLSFTAGQTPIYGAEVLQVARAAMLRRRTGTIGDSPRQRPAPAPAQKHEQEQGQGPPS
jgi:glycosyltransferase involved in cell wall biosynthesis